MDLYEHQKEGLERTNDRNRVAYYWDMGTGKTFEGSEKMRQLGAKVNLIVCQKSKVNDWIEHFETYYKKYSIWDLTKRGAFDEWKFFDDGMKKKPCVLIINYDLIWRRPELLKLKNFTLLLDESSLIQNEKAKRSKFILKMDPANVILLSGTPTGGKYERLWSQMRLLGWNISKRLYYSQYVIIEYLDTMDGRSIPIVKGYKNVDRLKRKMREHGCDFLKTEDVFDLPEQTFQNVKVDTSKEYRKFRKDKIITIDTKNLCEFHDDSDFYGKDVTPRVELVGDTTLTRMLYERQLCGAYSHNKMIAFRDLVKSTDDRLIVFYNFTAELDKLINIVAGECDKKFSIVNGKVKDLMSYEKYSDSVTFIQYQAGAMGLNLQKANKIIYFSLPLSSELFEQSKKRIHRIGQKNQCIYYLMICKNSVEEKILQSLKMRKDFTEKLFEETEG